VTILAEFKRFLMRGNLVELAVAFVIAVVFAALVKAFIADLITPIVGLIFGKRDFGALSFTINGSLFRYGDFLNNLDPSRRLRSGRWSADFVPTGAYGLSRSRLVAGAVDYPLTGAVPPRS
jgi:large conductance mechanosensitive channel